MTIHYYAIQVQKESIGNYPVTTARQSGLKGPGKTLRYGAMRFRIIKNLDKTLENY